MKAIILLSSLIIFTGCSSFDFNNVHPLEYSWQAMHVIDVMQTATMARNNDCSSESDPITSRLIGKRPSESDVYKWGAAMAVFHFVAFNWISDHTTENQELMARSLKTALKYRTIAQNHSKGFYVDGFSTETRQLCERIRESHKIHTTLYRF